MTVEIDNRAYPYTTVTFIESRFPDGAVFTGSGVFVGPNDVLTASHVVYDGAHGGAATSVKVIPGYDPAPLDEPYGEIFGQSFRYFQDVDPNNDGLISAGNGGPGLSGAEIDFALISLNRATGDLTGWMGVDPNFSQGIVNVTGYPAFYGRNPMNDTGSASEDSVDFIYRFGSLEIHAGNSGGPVWYSVGGTPYVISVVSTGTYGAQLSGSNFSTLLGWIAENDDLIVNADRNLRGTDGYDSMTTGGGNDTISSFGGDDGVIAGAGNDIVFGGAGNDKIYGQDGNDTLNGEAGDDSLDGGNGLDILRGGDGNDFVDGGPGNDTLDGGLGADTYIVGDAGDSITDAGGVDTVQSYIPWTLGAALENLNLIGTATLGIGNSGDNVIVGNASANYLTGLGGSDMIQGGSGDDWMEGESGNNPLPGGHTAGNDTIDGGAGNDTVLAGGGNDVVYGGSGTDILVGESGNDLIYGGSEFDAIDGRQGSDVLYGEGGNDIIFGDGYFYLFGFANDSLFGGDGADIMMGEAGEASTSGAGDAIYGEGGNDLLDGGAGNDAIYGGEGNDVIDGDHGNDYIVGGPGAEIMLGSNAVGFGGATQGSDLFVYQSMADAGDSIYGFDTRVNIGENDGIDLRPLFDALGYAGTTPRAAGTNLLRVADSGGNALVQIDPDGAPGPQGFTTLVTLVGLSAATITDSFFLFQ